MEHKTTPPATFPEDNNPSKRVQDVFMLVDTSAGMSGYRIACVNQAIREMIPELMNAQRMLSSVEIRLALMHYDTTARWFTPDPVPVDMFAFANWSAGGGTNVAQAFDLLSEKLSRKAFMNAPAGHYAPVIILWTRGESVGGWESQLKKLRNNRWYSCAKRLAIAVDGESTTPEAMGLLYEFTQNPENIIRGDQPNEIVQSILRNFVVFS